MRAFDTSSDICPSIFAAGVPVLGEYTKVNAPANPTLLTSDTVSLKSSSVSVGNPTIISVVMAISGIYFLKSATLSRYSALV